MLLNKMATEKGATALKEQYDKLLKRIGALDEHLKSLTFGTPYGALEAVPDHDIFENLEEETSETAFWSNFKEVAPILLCYITDKDKAVSAARDHSVSTELLKSKSILEQLRARIEKPEGEKVDIYDFTLALKTLEEKVRILRALKNPSSDPTNVSYRVKGSNFNMKVDVEKLREAITFEPVPEGEEVKVDTEKQAEFELEGEEAEFLAKLVSEKEIERTERGTLTKDSLVLVMKCISDLAKFKSKEIMQKAQDERMKSYKKDEDAYLRTVGETLEKEEQNYNFCSTAVLSKLKISPDTFMRSEAEIMSNPMVQMEMLQKGLENEAPSTEVPEELTREKTKILVKESNDAGFEYFKKKITIQRIGDPMMTPVIISCLSHDYILQNYEYPEEVFKAAMFKHKLFEDPEIAMHMQKKQMELFGIPPGFGGMPGGGMPGMPGGMPGMGGGLF